MIGIDESSNVGFVYCSLSVGVVPGAGYFQNGTYLPVHVAAATVIGLCIIAADCEIAFEQGEHGFVCVMFDPDSRTEWVGPTCSSRVEAVCRTLAIKLKPVDEVG